MKKWKAAGKKLLFPPVWVLVVLTLLSGAALVAVFVMGWEEAPIAYAVYVVAFYTVVVLSVFFYLELPRKYREIKQKIYNHPLGNRYMTDAGFKVRVPLVNSLAINLAYSVFKFASGIYYSSLWIGSIAVYYILLSVIRFVLLDHMERKQHAGLIQEYKSCRFAAFLMGLINLTLSAIVLSMIYQDQTPAISDIFVITSATYTFYILSASIRDLIKFRQYKRPILSAAKAVRLAQALVSLLSLEASMLVQFGDDEVYRRIMLAVTGAAVCIMVLTMSIYMIVRANKQIKKLSEEMP